MIHNVVCCLWGNWPEKGWGPDYVDRLYRGVRRNLKQPFQFICFSDNLDIDVDPGIQVRALLSPSWKGCLPKIYVYSPQAGLSSRTLLFDLDNVITGDLTEMAAYDGDLAVRAWFKGYDRGERVPDGDMIGFNAGSDFAYSLWRRFSRNIKEIEAQTGGRERFFLRENATPDLWQDILPPNSILSYKNHLRMRDLPEQTCIVSFHDGGKEGGTQRPHQVDVPWLKEHWR